MVKVKCTNIHWDTDGDKKLFENLPQEVVITLDEYNIGEYLDDAISDKLSDMYGFCHEGYEYKIIDGTKGYEINYRLKTTSIFAVEAKNKKEAKEIALKELEQMSKEELIERFLDALEFEREFTITNCEEIH